MEVHLDRHKWYRSIPNRTTKSKYWYIRYQSFLKSEVHSVAR